MKDRTQQGRRDALKTIVMGAGGLTTLPILGHAAPVKDSAAAPEETTGQSGADWKPLFLDEHQNETVIVLSDLIIPATDTPGAKAALVNRYIDLVYNEEAPKTKMELIEGLAWLDGRCMSEHGMPFVDLPRDQQTAILKRLADPANKNPEDRRGVVFFQLIKDLTLFGYYTSEIGMVQELHYGGDTYHTSFPGACTHPEHQS